MDAIINVSSINDINIDSVDAALESHGYAIIRGIYDQDDLKSCVSRLKTQFSAENDNPTVGETPKDVQSNFQKLLVGGKTQSDDYLTRLFRVFYNPMWDEDIFHMRSHFSQLIKVRNLLMDVPQDFALEHIDHESGLWSACRLHQYPCGGAFMSMHRDYIVDGHLKERNLSFYQLLLNLSKKGEDFEKGGAYVYKNGEKVDLDAVADIGDIIVYNGSSLHGVEEVDPHKRLDLTMMNGRIVAFATLYHDKSKENTVSTLDDEVKYNPKADS